MLKLVCMNELNQFIKNQGWSMYGIISFEESRKNLKKHEKIFQEWLKKGYEADMDYLEKMEEDRFHPEYKLPDVKSIIVLGAWYNSQNSAPLSGEYSAVISRYARGKDYHKVLKKRLAVLADFLETRRTKSETRKFPVSTYLSVDSGPTVDRVLAESAGLGFFGKNSSIINPKMGSYFFIASLMTNVSVEGLLKFYGGSIEKSIEHQKNINRTSKGSLCGDCNKCQNACPTGAIVSPGVIDARKCISYLTIENKGEIPIDLRSKIGNHLFGCDACQECCPFNTRDLRLTIKDLSPECGAGESLDLKEVLSIKTDEEFTEKFAGNPLMRVKRIGLLRNACVVAGNSGDKSLITYLEKVEGDEMVKEHAEWGIDRLKNN